MLIGQLCRKLNLEILSSNLTLKFSVPNYSIASDLCCQIFLFLCQICHLWFMRMQSSKGNKDIKALYSFTKASILLNPVPGEP